ncbi:hypothetical protein Tco_0490118 [Tanacetum coccineum]
MGQRKKEGGKFLIGINTTGAQNTWNFGRRRNKTGEEKWEKGEEEKEGKEKKERKSFEQMDERKQSGRKKEGSRRAPNGKKKKGAQEKKGRKGEKLRVRKTKSMTANGEIKKKKGTKKEPTRDGKVHLGGLRTKEKPARNDAGKT